MLQANNAQAHAIEESTKTPKKLAPGLTEVKNVSQTAYVRQEKRRILIAKVGGGKQVQETTEVRSTIGVVPESIRQR